MKGKDVIKVLVVESESKCANFLSKLLDSKKYSLKFIDNVEIAKAELKRSQYHIILVCSHLGFDVFKLFREKHPDLAIVALFDKENTKLEQKLINLGVQDCLVRKDITADNFHRAIQNAIWRHSASAVQQVNNGVQQAQNILGKDELTGLVNRQKFEKKLEKVIKAASKHGHVFGLLLININDFKQINDIYGYEVGDQLLKAFSAYLKSILRTTDILARLAGDEFGVLLKEIHAAEDAGKVAQKLLISCQNPFFIGTNKIKINLTIGIVCYPAGGETVTELLQHLYVALFHAKEGGKENYQFFSNKYNKLYTKNLSLARDLGVALEKNELFPVYQPQFSLPNQKLSGMEVLMRWHHPKLGLVLPDDFIRIAEQNGLINSLGEWIMKVTYEQYVHWEKRGYNLGTLAINLSALQLKEPGFISKVQDIIHETGMKVKNLEFELTESAVMTFIEEIEPVLQQIHNIGIRIAIDDFGTGYSSFSRLNILPVDILKIDKSFIQAIGRGNADKIVKSILLLAENLDLKVVAEGVETVEQLNFLKENKCAYMQGFYLSQPLSEKQMQAFLDEQ